MAPVSMSHQLIPRDHGRTQEGTASAQEQNLTGGLVDIRDQLITLACERTNT